MKKIKTKIFFVLFSILSFFLIIILTILNATLYYNEYNQLQEKITKIENMNLKLQSIIVDDKNPLFMDLGVYVIYFDSNENMIDIINYANDGLTAKDILSIAKKGLNKYSQKINLYFNNYYFSLNHKNEIIIINYSTVKTKLLFSLKISILLFILLEITIIYASTQLTKWLSKPIEDTFIKQKQFICDASHELKTPLSIIMASADALENNPEETKWLNNIKSESEKMHKLVIDLLELSKIESGEKDDTYIKTDLSKLIEKSLLPFESIIYEKGLHLEYTIEPNINYKCNEIRIKQLVSILVDNAIKHAFTNSKITVNFFKEKDEINLLVKNRGIAIPKADQEKIFERFYRVDDSRNRNQNRYGLGLAIAKNIVLNHNGKITVNCSDGYTTFKVILKEKL